jgi:ferrous-iron efflux pump FieF
VAMLASLADSALDLFTSGLNMLAIRSALTPADAEHRFGHGKAEALAALIQVILITVSALGIAWRAIDRMGSGERTADLELGVAVSIVAMAATFGLLAYQRYVIRRTDSVAIHTDHVHYQSDLLLNLGVIAALGLDQLLGWKNADPVFGLGIAAWLLYNAWSAASQSVDQLMDREWPEAERDAFLAATQEYPELAGLHDLRTRHSGSHRFVQFHVWVPPEWSVKQAHDSLERVEHALCDRFPATEIIIHLDPEGHTDRETLLSRDLTESAR